MSQFRDAYDEFRRANVEVAAVSVDSPYSHRAWAKELGVPYPLISDFGREFIESYRVPEGGTRLLPRTAKRSAFVVDAAGIIRYVWHASEGAGRPSVQEILEVARSLPESGDTYTG